jgi:hypothetical protein
MGENISKLMYLSLGALLMVLALSAFFRQESSLLQFERTYYDVKNHNRSWAQASTETNENPYKNLANLPLSDCEEGLVYEGISLKAQLIGMEEEEEKEVYINGSPVTEEELKQFIQSIDPHQYYRYSYKIELLRYEITKI